MKLNKTTKNGYAISIMEASDAFRFLILEKIRKFAKVAKTPETIISSRTVFPELITFFKCSPLEITKGKVITAAKSELINKRVMGEILERIFWSMA